MFDWLIPYILICVCVVCIKNICTKDKHSERLSIEIDSLFKE